MSTRPFTLRLHVPSGDPESILVASRDDWVGKAVIFPRELIGIAKGRKEYKQPGVYLLVGGKKAYIGEGDCVGDRLDDHAAKKAFWRRAVFFTADSNRLNKAHIQHIEAGLIQLAKEAGRVDLQNVNSPQAPVLSEEDRAFAENFLADILSVLPLLGFWQFTQEDAVSDEIQIQATLGEESAQSQRWGKKKSVYDVLPHNIEFKLNNSGVKATLRIAPGGVIVGKGSQVVDPPQAHFQLHCLAYSAQRQQLIDSGLLTKQKGNMELTADQFFSSASAAASVVCGRAKNADHWIGPDGMSLGDLLRKERDRS